MHRIVLGIVAALLVAAPTAAERVPGGRWTPAPERESAEPVEPVRPAAASTTAATPQLDHSNRIDRIEVMINTALIQQAAQTAWIADRLAIETADERGLAAEVAADAWEQPAPEVYIQGRASTPVLPAGRVLMQETRASIKADKARSSTDAAPSDSY